MEWHALTSKTQKPLLPPSEMTFLPSCKKVIVVSFEELYVQEVCAAQEKHYNGLIQSLIFLPENSGEGLCM